MRMIFYWVEVGEIELIIWPDGGQLASLLYTELQGIDSSGM